MFTNNNIIQQQLLGEHFAQYLKLLSQKQFILSAILNGLELIKCSTISEGNNNNGCRRTSHREVLLQFSSIRHNSNLANILLLLKFNFLVLSRRKHSLYFFWLMARTIVDRRILFIIISIKETLLHHLCMSPL